MTHQSTPQDLCVLLTVGTSLASGKVLEKHSDIREAAKEIEEAIKARISYEHIESGILNDPVLTAQVDTLVRQMEKADLLVDTQNSLGAEFPFDDRNLSTAELQSSLKWMQHQPAFGNVQFRLYPSISGNSILNAMVFKSYIRSAHSAGLIPNCRHIEAFITPLSINVDNHNELYRSVDILFEAFDNAREAAEKSKAQIVINPTGGYKAISAFATLYGQIHRHTSLYTFGKANAQVVELPALPMSFALDALDDEMTLLKGIQTLAKSGNTLGLEQENVFNSLPDWIQGMLVREEGKIEPLGIAQTLLNSYEETRSRVTGPGSTLLGFLEEKDPQMADAFHKQINGPWSQLWMGDQIPETVEHSRRHSKRLMETGGNIFRSVGDRLEEMGMMDAKVLSLLIASIYLHDIGHTALTFQPENSKGPAFPLDLFPSAVREVHHLLSCELIRKKADKLLPADQGFTEMHRQIVPLICAHHRGYTTLKGSAANLENKRTIKLVGELLFGDKAFAETLQPLGKRIENLPLKTWGITPTQVLQAAALLRVIDGCDVQADRAVSSDYLKARLERTKTEASALWQRLQQFGDDIPEEFTNPILLSGVDPEDPPYDTKGKSIMERIADWGDKLKTEDAQNGTIPPEVRKEIKEVSRLVYERIFEILNGRKLVTRNFAFLMEDPGYTLALSLLNRVTFKWEQFLHFYKHISVAFVLPIRDGDKCKIGIWQPKDSLNTDDLESVKNDIWEEFTKGGVSEILEIDDSDPDYEGNLFHVKIMNDRKKD